VPITEHEHDTSLSIQRSRSFESIALLGAPRQNRDGGASLKTPETMNPGGNHQFTREELYAKVWAAPTTQVAAELGISDVALAKRCKKLNVPKPSLGYWAKVAAGQKPEQTPLPPTASEIFMHAAEKPLAKTLPIPETTEQLHSLAAELMRTMTAGKPDSDKRVNVRERTLPEAIVSKALIERVAKAFHAILNGVETLGIAFRKAQSSYDSGYFQKGHDRLYLKIEEEMVEQPVQSGRPTRRHSWQWPMDRRVASGKLTFSLSPKRYGFREEKKWKEEDKTPLGELLAKIVTEIRRHYVEAQKRRAQEAIEREKQRVESERHWREYQAKEAIRLEEERKRKHAEALDATAHMRSEDLLKAAEWWRLHQSAAAFVNECEQRWLTSQAGGLTSEQEAWLKWAWKHVNAMSPFETGYPDPLKDGAFDPATVPFAGPYPAKRSFPRPPTMPKTPQPVAQQSGRSSE